MRTYLASHDELDTMTWRCTNILMTSQTMTKTTKVKQKDEDIPGFS